MSERWRLVFEGVGALLLVVAAAMVYPALGVFVAAILLIAVANFYGGNDDDASPDERP